MKVWRRRMSMSSAAGVFMAMIALFLSCGVGGDSEQPIRFRGVAENIYGLDKVVIHTIDDYSQDLIPFLDAIQHHKVRSTVFVDRTSRIPGEDWIRLNKVYNDGNEIGSHTRSHAYIYYPADEETANLLLNDYELSGSFDDIRSHTSQPHVWSFAYPGGEQYQYPSIHRKLEAAGYIAARRFTGFANLNENWEVIVQDSYKGRALPQSRYALKPDRPMLGDDMALEWEYLRQAFERRGAYHFVTHPKGLGFSPQSPVGTFLAMLDSLENTWFSPMGYYAQYQLLSDSLSLNLMEAGPGRIDYSLSCGLSPGIYIIPVTLVFTTDCRVTRITHDGNKVTAITDVPCHASIQESYFQRADSLFLTVHPWGVIHIAYDTTEVSGPRRKAGRTTVLNGFHPLADPPADSKSSPAYHYNALRDSVLKAIADLKRENPDEAASRMITYLYYKIGARDSALVYLKRSGAFRKGFNYWGKLHVNLMRLLSTRKEYPLLDRIIRIPAGFENRNARSMLIADFLGTMYGTLIGGMDKFANINTEILLALYLMDVYNEQTIDVLTVKEKCLDYLIARIDDAEAVNSYKQGAAENLNTLGNLYFKAADMTGAARAFEKAIVYEPRNALAHYNAGMAYAVLGDPRKAGRHFEDAIAIQPGFARAIYMLGVLSYEQGDESKGVRLLKESKRLGFQGFEERYRKLVEE